jgi:hypothetical protein
MEIMIFLIALVVLDIAASRWGPDSTDDVRSPEWERRRAWRGFARPGR